MMRPNQSIPCPVCNTKIIFDIESLLSGQKFSCPKCSAVIGLSKESVEPTKEILEKYKKLSESGMAKKRQKINP